MRRTAAPVNSVKQRDRSLTGTDPQAQQRGDPHHCEDDPRRLATTGILTASAITTAFRITTMIPVTARTAAGSSSSV